MNYFGKIDSFDDGAPCRCDRANLESPIEVIFIDAFEKYASSKVEVYPQFEVSTQSGNFRLDFLIQLGDRKIGIECDGKDFHDDYRDEWRDAIILGNGKVDTIYRFRGKDLYWGVNDCIHLIYHYDKEFFNSRYQHNFPRLISDDLREKMENDPFVNRETHWIAYYIYGDEGNITGASNLLIYRRDKLDKKGFWNSLYRFAGDNPGLSLDQLIALKSQSK